MTHFFTLKLPQSTVYSRLGSIRTRLKILRRVTLSCQFKSGPGHHLQRYSILTLINGLTPALLKRSAKALYRALGDTQRHIESLGWELHFPYYVSTHTRVYDGHILTSTFSFFFITFWLIRWIHGDAVIREMSARDRLEQI